MRPLTVEFIKNSVSGKLSGGEPGREITEVCTDTRDIRPGCLFVALKGERFDGHDFIADAFKKGAAAALSRKEVPCARGPVVVVDDTEEGLRRLAAAYRNLFDIPVAGITGSVGKTSTKEMVCAVFSRKFRTHKNTGNRNNQIGMPMSVFGLDDLHQAAVFEMGMSGFGEISALSRIARPCIGIITNIGISHIEKLGSQKNILKAKLEILDGMNAEGTMVLNGDDEFLASAAGSIPLRTVTYGVRRKDCDVAAEDVREDSRGISFTVRSADGGIEARLPVAGMHNVYNALAAFAAGRLLGITPEQAVQGFADYSPTGLRQKIVRRSGVVFVEDCYNASPDSMSAAFQVLSSLEAPGRKIAVLGDMLELGKFSAAAHENVGKAAAESGVDLLFACGSEAARYCEGFLKARPEAEKNCRFFEDKSELARELAGTLREGDAVLFKASRNMRFEEIIAKTCENARI